MLGRYDAAWLHVFRSRNGGDLRRATWDDLNAPARLATYAASGLPLLCTANPGSVVAAERLARDAAVAFDGADDLVDRLRDRAGLAAARAAAREGRARFTFDAWCEQLVAFLCAAASGEPDGVLHDAAGAGGCG